MLLPTVISLGSLPTAHPDSLPRTSARYELIRYSRRLETDGFEARAASAQAEDSVLATCVEPMRLEGNRAPARARALLIGM